MSKFDISSRRPSSNVADPDKARRRMALEHHTAPARVVAPRTPGPADVAALHEDELTDLEKVGQQLSGSGGARLGEVSAPQAQVAEHSAAESPAVASFKNGVQAATKDNYCSGSEMNAMLAAFKGMSPKEKAAAVAFCYENAHYLPAALCVHATSFWGGGEAAMREVLPSVEAVERGIGKLMTESARAPSAHTLYALSMVTRFIPEEQQGQLKSWLFGKGYDELLNSIVSFPHNLAWKYSGLDTWTIPSIGQDGTQNWSQKQIFDHLNGRPHGSV